jgi:hypothetical protein
MLRLNLLIQNLLCDASFVLLHHAHLKGKFSGENFIKELQDEIPPRFIN